MAATENLNNQPTVFKTRSTALSGNAQTDVKNC